MAWQAETPYNCGSVNRPYLKSEIPSRKGGTQNDKKRAPVRQLILQLLTRIVALSWESS